MSTSAILIYNRQRFAVQIEADCQGNLAISPDDRSGEGDRMILLALTEDETAPRGCETAQCLWVRGKWPPFLRAEFCPGQKEGYQALFHPLWVISLTQGQVDRMSVETEKSLAPVTLWRGITESQVMQKGDENSYGAAAILALMALHHAWERDCEHAELGRMADALGFRPEMGYRYRLYGNAGLAAEVLLEIFKKDRLWEEAGTILLRTDLGPAYGENRYSTAQITRAVLGDGFYNSLRAYLRPLMS